jgi:CBS domain-containing protein
MQIFRVDEWMQKNVITVHKEWNVTCAAELMQRHSISCLIVVQDEAPIGIVTERDIVRQVVAKRKNPDVTNVSDVMTDRLYTIESGTPITEVSSMMVRFRIKQMPVIEQGKLKGIITTSDIVKTMVAFNRLYEIKDIIELNS